MRLLHPKMAHSVAQRVTRRQLELTETYTKASFDTPLAKSAKGTRRLDAIALVRSVHGLDRRAERIPHTAFGKDELRLRGVGLDLAAQPQHLNVNGSVVDLIVIDAAGL
jgi:hypothetical protein